jgi:hypothetical protein
MSSTNRNFAVAYAFLVILPLVGLAGILKSGRNLKAPVSIDGIWSLQVDSAQLSSLPCGKILTAVPDLTIAISQSGNTFVVNFPGVSKIAGVGKLEGTTLQATVDLPPQVSSDNCASGGQLSLLATLERDADSKSLLGSFSAPNCPTCASVVFQAARPTPATANGGR